MQLLSESELKIIEDNKSEFVSFKYIDENGNLKQIDSFARNLNRINEPNIHKSGIIPSKPKINLPNLNSFICNNEIKLKPINDKIFTDPFRSFPTTTIFCENIASEYNSRDLANNIITKEKHKFELNLSAEISFWTSKDPAQEETIFGSDIIDKYANLRSDIISTLESININTTIHYCGTCPEESIIGIKAKNIIDLADNILITKFIIANIADSYGLKARFTKPNNCKKPNISIIIEDKPDEISNLLQNIKNNLDKESFFSSKIQTYSFELAEMNTYKIDIANNILKINLICGEIFVPYLALIDLLLIHLGKEHLNEEAQKYFF